MSRAESKVGSVLFFRLDENEDLLGGIKERAEKSGVKAGFFFLIGTVKKAILGYYKQGKYQPINLAGPLEIISCLGNISVKEDGELMVHAHVALANAKGEMFGGHLLSVCPIDATGELVIVDAPDARLRRRLNKKLNLNLWSFGK